MKEPTTFNGKVILNATFLSKSMNKSECYLRVVFMQSRDKWEFIETLHPTSVIKAFQEYDRLCYEASEELLEYVYTLKVSNSSVYTFSTFLYEHRLYRHKHSFSNFISRYIYVKSDSIDFKFYLKMLKILELAKEFDKIRNDS